MITKLENGAIICTGDGVDIFRMVALQKALALEVRTGMKMSRGLSAFAAAKRDYGLKGNKNSVLDQLTAMVNDLSPKRGAND